MIIEFFGLSGSGKTTLARKLAENKDFRLLKIRRKKDLVFFNLKYLWNHPMNFLKLFILVIKNSDNPKQFYYKFMNCFLDYNAKFQMAKTEEAAILDQGYYQNIISLFNHKMGKEELTAYLGLIPEPDILFVFDASEQTRKRRQAERGYGTRMDFSKEEHDRFVGLAEKNFELFMNNYKDLCPDTIVVDAESGVDDIISRIMDNIKK